MPLSDRFLQFRGCFRYRRWASPSSTGKLSIVNATTVALTLSARHSSRFHGLGHRRFRRSCPSSPCWPSTIFSCRPSADSRSPTRRTGLRCSPFSSFPCSPAIFPPRARQQAEDASARRREIEKLYTFSQGLLESGNVIQLLNRIPAQIVDIFEVGAAALLLAEKQKIYRSGPVVATSRSREPESRRRPRRARA